MADDGLTLGAIVAARRRLAPYIRRTPLLPSAFLSARAGAPVSLKLESLQVTSSFKARGALNAALLLRDALMAGAPPVAASRASAASAASAGETRAFASAGASGAIPGVSRMRLVTASSGNHGRALSYAARMAGFDCSVFAPASTPRTKLDAIRANGADLITSAPDYDEAERAAKAFVAAASTSISTPASVSTSTSASTSASGPGQASTSTPTSASSSPSVLHAPASATASASTTTATAGSTPAPTHASAPTPIPTAASPQPAVYISPYNDPRIVAATGTIALELFDDCPELDTIVVPLGGGGLIAGIALAAKAIKPGVRVIGVEAAANPAFHTVRRDGAHTPIDPQPTLADGVSGNIDAGSITLDLVARLVDEIVLVDEASIARAVRDLAIQDRLVSEGAGALASAAISLGLVTARTAAGASPAGHDNREPGTIVAMVSGSNIDGDRLASLLNPT